VPVWFATQGLAGRLRVRGSELRLGHCGESSKQAEANFGDASLCLTCNILHFLLCGRHRYASIGPTTKGLLVKHSIAALGAAVVLVGSLMIATPSYGTTTSSTATGSSDVDIVDALAYGAGDLASELGTEVGKDLLVSDSFDLDDYRAKAHAASIEVVAAEEQRLKPVIADLRSGDVYRVQRGSAHLGQIVVEHTRAEMDAEGIAPAGLPSAEGSGRCGVAVVCVAYAAVGVHNAAVATAAAAVVVSVALWCGAWTWCGKAAAGDDSTAARERLAVQIVSTVA
jgi:hypothetical protein